MQIPAGGPLHGRPTISIGLPLSIDIIAFCPDLLFEVGTIAAHWQENRLHSELQYRSAEYYRSVISILSGAGHLWCESRENVGRCVLFTASGQYQPTDTIITIDIIDFRPHLLSEVGIIAIH